MNKLLNPVTLKKFLFLVLSLLMAVSVNAQRYFNGSHSDYTSDDFYQPRIGLTAGVSFSNTTGSSSTGFTTSTLTGFNGGITFDLPVVYPLSFAPEALYAQRGYKAATPNGNYMQQTRLVDIPLLAKFDIGPVVSVYIGPQVSFLLSKQNTFDSGFAATTIPFYNRSSSKQTYFDADFGIAFNLTPSINLYVRYIIDLQQTGANGNAYVPGYSNQAWQTGLEFKF